MSNLYTKLIEIFEEFPIWLQEGLIERLQDEMKKQDDENYVPENPMYANFQPQITYSGRKALTGGESPGDDMSDFLILVQNGKDITEVTLEKEWTLEETSKIFYEAIERQFCVKPKNEIFVETCYLSGKIRIGEYLKRLGTLDVDQLEIALRKQKEYEEQGIKKGFVSILEELSFAKYKDVENILKIKQECKKRYVPPKLDETEDTVLIEKLKYENNLLKSKLREFLNIKR